MPDVEIERAAPLRFPARVMLNAAASAEYFGVAGLNGVTAVMKGRRAASAVSKLDGTARGRVEMKGESKDGVEGCKDLQ